MLWNTFDMSKKKAPGFSPWRRMASNIAGLGREVWGG